METSWDSDDVARCVLASVLAVHEDFVTHELSALCRVPSPCWWVEPDGSEWFATITGMAAVLARAVEDRVPGWEDLPPECQLLELFLKESGEKVLAVYHCEDWDEHPDSVSVADFVPGAWLHGFGVDWRDRGDGVDEQRRAA